MPYAPRILAQVGVIATIIVLGACGDGGAGTGTIPTNTPLTLRISPKADSLGVGETRQLTAAVTDRSGAAQPATVAWMSLNSAVATVSANGTITGLSAGLTGIVATIGTSADTAAIYVRAGQLVVEPNAVNTVVGEELRFSASTRAGQSVAASSQTLMWQSSDPTIARVDANGSLTALGAGDVTITASAGTQQGSAVVTVRQKDIASIRVTPSTSAIYPNAPERLDVTAYDDAGRVMALADGTARWTSSNTGVLLIDDSGVATGKTMGSAVVSARIGPKSATATVNVLAVAVANVAVSLGASTLDVGQTTSATAALTDASGNSLTGRTVAWQSSNSAVAAVNASGVVTTFAKGVVTITAIAEGKTGTASLTVAAKTVAQVAVTPNPAAATVGQTAQLVAVPKDAQGTAMTGRTITWTSSNSAVASVSSTGLVTAVSAGSATISATADGVAGQAAFTSTATTAASVSVTPSDSHVQVGQPLALVASVYDASGNLLTSRVPTWASSNPTVATVANDGRVTGVSTGTATIVATVDGKSASAAIGVDAPPPAPVAAVAVALASQSLTVGQSTQASAVLRDASGTILTGRTISWSSAAPELATVSANGIVTAVAAGSATIVATSEGQTGSATLVIGTAALQPVATVALSATSPTMFAGQSQTISVTLKDAQGNTLGGRTIAWSSSSLGVVTVSPAGLVQAVGVGTATVTATSEGKTGSITLSVSSAPVVPVASVSLVSTTTSITVGQTAQMTATPLDGHGAALTGRTVTWSSSSPSVASVSNLGVVTGIAAGQATVTASVDGVVASLPMTVMSTGGTPATVAVSTTSAALTIGQTTQASATVRDGAGNMLSTAATWSSSNPGAATVSASGVVTAVGVGSALIKATVSTVSGSTSVSVTSTTTSGVAPTLAELPRSVPSFTIPASTRTVRVTAPADLQAALANAVGGDSLVLSGTFTGNYTLPSRPCGSWITIASAGTIPPAGTRVTPASAAGFAKIVTPNTARALQTAQPTCGWRVVGVEIAATANAGIPNTSLNYGIVWLGDGGWTGGGETQTSLAKVPQNIIIDRVYLHGAPTTNSTRCLKLDSGNTIIRDSWLGDCHALGSDSQAILGCNGPGPFLIENNQLEGAGENVMFGGCDPAAPELVPSDITFRRNHVRKDPSWKGVWTIKNPFELKDARRVLIEGNVFENSWVAAQLGMAIVIKSSTETCGACTWEGTKDVTVRWNVFKNAHRGLNIQAIDGSSAGTTASHTERVTVEQNVFTGIGTSNGIAPSDGWLMLLTHDLKDISISHNTLIGNAPGYGLAAYFTYSGGAAQRIAINDNVFAGQSYYALASDGGLHTSALTAFAGTSWSFARNVVAQVDGQFAGANPSASTFLASVGAIGLASDGSLSTSSPYRASAVGVDMAELGRRTSGVVVAP